MLKVEGIETWYGAIQAIKGISLGRESRRNRGPARR